MFKIDTITKNWKEAGAFMAQVNLYGFWDEHCFLTKSGDLGCALKIGGIDAESLDHAGRDYVVKRLEAALRSLDEKTRLHQILFRHNRPEIPRAEYTNPLVRAAVEQRADFLRAKADRLYSVENLWIVIVDSSYAKTGLLHALSQLPKSPRSSIAHALCADGFDASEDGTGRGSPLDPSAICTAHTQSNGHGFSDGDQQPGRGLQPAWTRQRCDARAIRDGQYPCSIRWQQ